MRGRALGWIVAVAVGMFSMMAASTAEGYIQCSACACSTPCSTLCEDGPEEPGCSWCNVQNCEVWGRCAGTSSCSGSCSNSACTSTISGTSGGDTLSGTSLNECISGFGGNDTLYGHAGDDRLYGDAGADTLFGGSGDDCLFGGDGNDHLEGETGADDFADGGLGTDTCYAETEVSCEL